MALIRVFSVVNNNNNNFNKEVKTRLIYYSVIDIKVILSILVVLDFFVEVV